jgi:hypothetical protein
MEVITREYEIDGAKFFFRNNMRALIDVERMIAEKGGKLGDLEESMIMLYCGTKSGMASEKKKFDIEFEDFVDIVDTHFDVLKQIFKGKDDVLEKAVEESKKK